MEAVQAKVRLAPRVPVYYELDGTNPSSPYTAGPGSFIHDLLTLAGAANVAAAAAGPFPRISAEEIIRANPELIIVPIGGFSPPDVADPQRFAQRPGWEAIEAVRRRAIRGVDADLVSRPGPRLVDGLKALARTIHPEVFG